MWSSGTRSRSEPQTKNSKLPPLLPSQHSDPPRRLPTSRESVRKPGSNWFFNGPIVHLLRQSLDFVSYKDRKAVAAALKGIYKAVDAATGEAALTAFEQDAWGRKYPAIGQSWRRAWGEVIPFYAFPDDVRRILYTTNAIEALNSKLRRAVRARGHFPNDEAALKLLFLVLNRSEKEWKMPPREWAMAKAHFAVLFGERFLKALAGDVQSPDPTRNSMTSRAMRRCASVTRPSIRRCMFKAAGRCAAN